MCIISTHVSEERQYECAGFGEIFKAHQGTNNENDRTTLKRLDELYGNKVIPYGDQFVDYLWNTLGMMDAMSEKAKNNYDPNVYRPPGYGQPDYQ